MKLQRINYQHLNARQKEIFNFQKVAGLLADYGFNCMKLADDWQGADFLAYHKDGKDTLKVQLKSRLTIDKNYVGKDLFMAFYVERVGSWYMIEHDVLLEMVQQETAWLETKSWVEHGQYSSAAPSERLRSRLQDYALSSTNSRAE